MDEVAVLPEIKILSAIRPEDNTAERLSYPNLEAEIQKQASVASLRWDQFLSAEPKSILEEQRAREMAQYYMLLTSSKFNQAVKVESRQRWAQRFTQASIEVYGAPQVSAVANIAHRELEYFKANKGSRVDEATLAKVTPVYEMVVANHGGTIGEERASDSVGEYKDQLENQYSEVLDAAYVFGQEANLEARQILKVFENALQTLKTQDESWADWQVISRRQSALEVEAGDHRIVVGSQRASDSAGTVRGLLAHELLVHAMRKVNADKYLEHPKGLPGYLDFEEGLGIFHEYVLGGKVPDKAADRYFDIALALGTNAPRLTRQSLFEFVVQRQTLRDQMNGKQIDLAEIDKKAYIHVGRIFRGTPGSADSPDQQGVFTKDIAYYKGFVKVMDYLQAQVSAGKTTKEIIDFMLVAKFDPTNPLHERYVREQLQIKNAKSAE